MQPASIVLLIASSVLWVWADDRPSAENRIVATVNGENITALELEAVVRTPMDDMEQRLRQLRQASLNKLIDNRLLEQAARAAGTDTGDYLRRNVESAGVSATEVDEACTNPVESP